jgi:DNA gyrase subunit A
MELVREISEELKTSYIDYAMSVIVGRALPDARDGLKPVQRRILYAMYEMGLFSNRPYRKSARIVGDVLGKYHPHGDTAVYDALVRMAQDFNMRYPLVDGQGNFGSIDGDEAAAMRYTEARLAKIAEEMLADIDKETVDFVPNFDSTLKEPVVLPARIPNLLINGASGIAVGMATNMPPHNLSEICDAIIAYIRNPDIAIDELMKFVKGPDFPTGGIIYGRAGIEEAYLTGKGKIVVRGRVEVEKNAVIIKEVPYQVNKAKLVEKIAELIKEGRLEEVKTVRDESDREGIRVVVELRHDADAEVVIRKLYSYTALQNTFGVINLALVDGEPRLLNLKEMIAEYVRHRREVVRRRTAFDLRKAEERLHIVEGLKKALEDVDNVVQLIKASASPSEAKTKLMEVYDLSEKQADAILQMRLQKLTSIEVDALMKEYEELKAKIAELKSILASEEKIDDIIATELTEIKEKYGDERRTEIVDDEAEIDAEELIAEEQNILVVTRDGYVKRVDMDAFRVQSRGGVGVIGASIKDGDLPAVLTICNTKHKLLIFTERKCYWVEAYRIPKMDRTARGVHIRKFIGLEEGERVVSAISLPDFSAELLILTEDGHIKRIKAQEFENAKRAGITASSGRIISVRLVEGNEVLIATRKGMAVRFSLSDVPSYGRTARGVKAIRLRKGDSIASMTTITNDGDILTLTDRGYAKRTPVREYRLTSRGSLGVINIRLGARNGEVMLSEFVKGHEELLTFSPDGYALRVNVSEISRQGRSAGGVLLSRKGIICGVVIKNEQ